MRVKFAIRTNRAAQSYRWKRDRWPPAATAQRERITLRQAGAVGNPVEVLGAMRDQAAYDRG
jgi:hypothetical protein